MDKKIKNVNIVKVIRITKLVGEGTERNPNKIVFEYWTTDGKKII